MTKTMRNVSKRSKSLNGAHRSGDTAVLLTHLPFMQISHIVFVLQIIQCLMCEVTGYCLEGGVCLSKEEMCTKDLPAKC